MVERVRRRRQTHRTAGAWDRLPFGQRLVLALWQAQRLYGDGRAKSGREGSCGFSSIAERLSEVDIGVLGDGMGRGSWEAMRRFVRTWEASDMAPTRPKDRRLMWFFLLAIGEDPAAPEWGFTAENTPIGPYNTPKYRRMLAPSRQVKAKKAYSIEHAELEYQHDLCENAIHG